jgi:hypothetical protein
MTPTLQASSISKASSGNRLDARHSRSRQSRLAAGGTFDGIDVQWRVQSDINGVAGVFYIKPYRFFHRVRDDVVWIAAVWHGAQIPEDPEA